MSILFRSLLRYQVQQFKPSILSLPFVDGRLSVDAKLLSKGGDCVHDIPGAYIKVERASGKPASFCLSDGNLVSNRVAAGRTSAATLRAAFPFSPSFNFTKREGCEVTDGE